MRSTLGAWILLIRSDYPKIMVSHNQSNKKDHLHLTTTIKLTIKYYVILKADISIRKLMD